MSKKKVVLLVDAGHLRAIAKLHGQDFTVPFVRSIVKKCIALNEELMKVLYYDCPAYKGTHALPISGETTTIEFEDNLLDQLEKLDFFAVRQGTLKFRGWKRKGYYKRQARQAEGDDDFDANIQQKGVDIRIGLDIASLAHKGQVDRIILITNDSDMTPAMKYARIAGLQVVLIKFVGRNRTSQQSHLLAHVDISRKVNIEPSSKEGQVQAANREAVTSDS